MSDRECTVPGCAHVHDVQCLLMSITSGGLRCVSRQRRTAPYGHPGVEILDEAFHERAGLWEELQTTIGRLSRSGESSPGGKASETPLPYHAQASAVAHRMRNELSTWARLIADQRPDLELPADYPPMVARWVAEAVAAVFVTAEMSSGLRGVVRDAERVIDRAPDKVYAGQCLEPLELADDAPEDEEPLRCDGQLYATKDKPRVRCRECGAVHEVQVRQEWLSRELDGQLVSAVEAAPVLSWLLDKKITGNNIAAWKRDGRVEVHDGRWPYRFGDLLVLAREMKPRNTGPRDREGSVA